MGINHFMEKRQKIVVIVRTRNESHRIAQFCTAYKDADRILVADGGSDDATVDIARSFRNVHVRYFDEYVKLANGHVRNNDSDHTNFLIRWAKEYQPTFVIYDDCDCRPNATLRYNYRSILARTDADYVMAVRIYLWGKDQYFPHMAKPGEGHTKWEPSLWAWRGNQDFSTVDVPPAFTFKVGARHVKDLHFEEKVLDLPPSYCLLHYSWDDAERVERKLRVYRESGLIKNMRHPLEMGGPLEPLAEWMIE